MEKNLANELKDYEVILTSEIKNNSLTKLLNVESAPSDISNFYSIDEIVKKFKPDTVVRKTATKFVNVSEDFQMSVLIQI